MENKTNMAVYNGEVREISFIDNDASRKAKNSVREYFRNYEKMLKALWQGLTAEEAGFKALNSVISGIAGGEGATPAVWLIQHFSRYIDAEGKPCNRRKDKDGNIYFTAANLSGVNARGILQRAALNCIESQRQGNRFAQQIVTPEEVRK